MRALALGLALALTATGAGAAELVITVENIRNAKGDMRVSVYSSPAEWPDKSARDHDQAQKARAGSVVFRYDLPPGTYAVNGLHDENGNGKMDTDFFGIPKEGYCFSNNVRPVLSAPSFESASFKLPPDGAAIAMRMMY
jgi:uncharacterized protein (DUF2141 family)